MKREVLAVIPFVQVAVIVGVGAIVILFKLKNRTRFIIALVGLAIIFGLFGAALAQGNVHEARRAKRCAASASPCPRPRRRTARAPYLVPVSAVFTTAGDRGSWLRSSVPVACDLHDRRDRGDHRPFDCAPGAVAPRHLRSA